MSKQNVVPILPFNPPQKMNMPPAFNSVSLLATYHRIIELQRTQPRPLVYLPNVEAFLRTNFLFPPEASFSLEDPKPIDIQKLTPIRSLPHDATNPDQTMQNNFTLTKMPIQRNPNTKTTITKSFPTQKPTQSKIAPGSKQATFIEKRILQDRYKLQELKKRVMKNRFSRIVGPFPATSLYDHNVDYLQKCVRRVIKEERELLAQNVKAITENNDNNEEKADDSDAKMTDAQSNGEKDNEKTEESTEVKVIEPELIVSDKKETLDVETSKDDCGDDNTSHITGNNTDVKDSDKENSTAAVSADKVDLTDTSNDTTMSDIPTEPIETLKDTVTSEKEKESMVDEAPEAVVVVAEVSKEDNENPTTDNVEEEKKEEKEEKKDDVEMIEEHRE